MNKIEKLLQELCPQGVEYKELGEVCEIVGGYAFKKQYFGKGNNKVIRIGDITPQMQINKFSGIYSTQTPSEKYEVKKHDFVMALSGATFGKIGKIIDSNVAYVNQRVALFKEKTCTGFIYYLLHTTRFKTYLNANVRGAAQPNISTNQISKFRIPIPPIEVQQEIVKILDTFEELTSGLVGSIPHEIKLRQQQYEYYREKLLTFKELKV